MARRHIMESTFRLNLLNPQHANSAMSEARKEVISLLGGALAGVKNSQPVVIANPQEDMEEQPEEDVMNDSDVAGLAMGWMLKGD